MEGKHFSHKADIGAMARRIADFERDAAVTQPAYSVSHQEFRDIWLLVDKLDRSFPQSKRPNIVQLLESLGDQRQAVQGTISKNEHEVKIAQISCQNLE